MLVVLCLVAWGVSLASAGRGDDSMTTVPEIVGLGVVSLMVSLMVLEYSRWLHDGKVRGFLSAYRESDSGGRPRTSRDGRVARMIVITVFVMVMTGAIVLV